MNPLLKLVLLFAALPAFASPERRSGLPEAALDGLRENPEPAERHQYRQLVDPDIVGGTVAHKNDFPFIVAILNNGTVLCSGSLLNANTVLTAAHCDLANDSPPLATYLLRTGSLQWNHGGIKAGVSKIVAHPGFDFNPGGPDLAVWRLSTPIHQSSTISYAKLPRQGEDPAVGSSVTLAGWGSISSTNTSDLSEDLRQVTIPVVSRKTCQASYSTDVANITANLFCAGPKAGGKDACFGDSGGPAVNTQFRVLEGFVSFGSPNSCGEPDHYGAYTRVGEYVDWINSHMFY